MKLLVRRFCFSLFHTHILSSVNVNAASVQYLTLFFLSKPAAFIIALTFPNMAGKAFPQLNFVVVFLGLYTRRVFPFLLQYIVFRGCCFPQHCHIGCVLFSFCMCPAIPLRVKSIFLLCPIFLHEETEFHVRGFICYKQPIFRTSGT